MRAKFWILVPILFSLQACQLADGNAGAEDRARKTEALALTDCRIIAVNAYCWPGGCQDVVSLSDGRGVPVDSAGGLILGDVYTPCKDAIRDSLAHL